MSSDSSSDADSSMTSSTTTEERNNSIDRNRNITSINGLMHHNANANVKQLTTFNNNLNNQIMSNEVGGTFKLLKKPPPVPHSTPIHRPLRTTEDDQEEEISIKEEEVGNPRSFALFDSPSASKFPRTNKLQQKY